MSNSKGQIQLNYISFIKFIYFNYIWFFEPDIQYINSWIKIYFIKGTPITMAPEILLGLPSNNLVDMYSLGVIIY